MRIGFFALRFEFFALPVEFFAGQVNFCAVQIEVRQIKAGVQDRTTRFYATKTVRYTAAVTSTQASLKFFVVRVTRMVRGLGVVVLPI